MVLDFTFINVALYNRVLNLLQFAMQVKSYEFYHFNDDVKLCVILLLCSVLLPCFVGGYIFFSFTFKLNERHLNSVDDSTHIE